MPPTYLPLSYRVIGDTCGLRWDDFAGEISLGDSPEWMA